jgi:hypothetical protein
VVRHGNGKGQASARRPGLAAKGARH